MDFSQKYDLIELLPGEGVQSYRARQTNTGRDVTVHLLMGGGKTPENEGFLVRLRAMQPQSMAKLIEVGEYQGAMFVVTVAPPYQRLDEWLAEQDRAAVAAKEFGKAGIWKRPDVGSLAPPPPPPRPIPSRGRNRASSRNSFSCRPRRRRSPRSSRRRVLSLQLPPSAEKDEFAELFSTAGKRDCAPADSGVRGGGMAIGTGRIYEDVPEPGCSAVGTAAPPPLRLRK